MPLRDASEDIDEDDEDEGLSEPLPAPREIFDQWRAPRFGDDNPTRMDNPVWAWLVRTRISAYAAVRRYAAGSALTHGPAWCFRRFGKSRTRLPGGRIVCIGGEHEDHYDPDFFIYNDVVVIAPDGDIAIYGYPREIFPPTDFHSATLVGDEIVVVGCLGYPEDRRARIEKVHLLDTRTWRFRTLPTSGDAPGWLHGHEARLEADGRHLRISGGKRFREDAPILLDNADVWSLSLDTGVWTRIEHRAWRRWQFVRADNAPNTLWMIRHRLWLRASGLGDMPGMLDQQDEFLGQSPGAGGEIEVIGTLYDPSLACVPLACVPIVASDEVEGDIVERIHRVAVDGVVVRYAEGMGGVTMTVEGLLPEATLATLIDDLRGKLARVEGVDYRAIEIVD